MSCFLFFATVLRLSNPLRGRPCLNTRLSLHTVHSSAPPTLTYTQGGRPGNVWGQGPVSPSGLTDWLARVRYLRAIWFFLMSFMLCAQWFLRENKTTERKLLLVRHVHKKLQKNQIGISRHSLCSFPLHGNSLFRNLS